MLILRRAKCPLLIVRRAACAQDSTGRISPHCICRRISWLITWSAYRVKVSQPDVDANTLPFKVWVTGLIEERLNYEAGFKVDCLEGSGPGPWRPRR